MCNWLEKDEVIEIIRDRIESLNNYIDYCRYQQSEFKDVYNTYDKFEAVHHENWRIQIFCKEQEIKFLKELLDEINEEKLEEVKEYEELYTQSRDIPYQKI